MAMAEEANPDSQHTPAVLPKSDLADPDVEEKVWTHTIIYIASMLIMFKP